MSSSRPIETEGGGGGVSTGALIAAGVGAAAVIGAGIYAVSFGVGAPSMPERMAKLLRHRLRLHSLPFSDCMFAVHVSKQTKGRESSDYALCNPRRDHARGRFGRRANCVVGARTYSA